MPYGELGGDVEESGIPFTRYLTDDACFHLRDRSVLRLDSVSGRIALESPFSAESKDEVGDGPDDDHAQSESFTK